MKRVWFFDLDGTLADTDPDIRASWKSAMRDLGLCCENFDRDFIAGPTIEEMAARLFPQSYTPELGAKLRERFGFHYDNDGFKNTSEYPGVKNIILRLKNAGARVFIATNKRIAGANALSAKFGWATLFEKIYAGDMFRDDPKIGMMNKRQLLAFAMKEIGVSADDCVMVGDTINDFVAAEQNNMTSIAVPWGYGTNEERARATRVAKTADEIF